MKEEYYEKIQQEYGILKEKKIYIYYQMGENEKQASEEPVFKYYFL